MPTEEQLKAFDDVFNEPLSDRSKPVPEDYRPPEKKAGESFEKFLKRLDTYNFQYYAGKE